MVWFGSVFCLFVWLIVVEAGWLRSFRALMRKNITVGVDVHLMVNIMVGVAVHLMVDRKNPGTRHVLQPFKNIPVETHNLTVDNRNVC